MQRHRHNVKVSKLLVGLRPYQAYRPGAALLGALRIRRLRFKAVSGLVSIDWGQNGAWCRKWRITTNVAHCDKYCAVISGVLPYITLPNLVRIGQHLPKLWPSEVFWGLLARATWQVAPPYGHVLMTRWSDHHHVKCGPRRCHRWRSLAS